MKTLEQIKDDYAVSKGFKDWEDLDDKVINCKDYDRHWINICIIAQKECLKLASENAYVYVDFDCPILDKDSITNKNNIIK